MSELPLILISGGLMLVGMLGLFVPVLPDLPLVWLGALVFGLFGEWGRWGPYLFAAITALGLVGVLAEVWGSGVGARLGGASLWGILGGLGLGVVGLLFGGPLGAIAGMLVGTFGVELVRQKDPQLAARSMLGMGVGYGVGLAAKLLLGLLMIGLWLIWLVLTG